MNKAKPKPDKPQPAPESKPGPKPDMLKIPGDWEDAVKTSLGKKKPAEGWPKEK